MARGKWLLLLDLDGTLWDHLDISSLDPPFRQVAPGVIVDRQGVEVRLYKYMAKLVDWARSSGGIVASFSWNTPYKAIEALHAFKLLGLFEYHLIEPHPWKGRMLARFLGCLRRCRRLDVPPSRIVYFDDRDIHLEDVYSSVGPVHYLKSHVDCASLEECKAVIAGRITANR